MATKINLLLFFIFLHRCFIPLNSSSFSSPNTSFLLQDVLKEISVKQKWELRDIKVSRLDLRRFKFGANRRFGFRVGLGATKRSLSGHFSDDVSSWKKFRERRTDFVALIDEVRSFAFLDTFKIKGPFELRVGDDDNDNPSLLLPKNRTQSGFKRILVGEGITIEVQKARSVSAFQASELGSTTNRSRNTMIEKGNFWPISRLICRPLVRIQVSGSAAFIAYTTSYSDGRVESNQISKETIELLADKCYDAVLYRKKRDFPVDSLSWGISKLEDLLKYLVKSTDGLVAFIRGKTSAIISIWFQVEIERESGSYFSREADFGWRTRPEVERLWFDVLASVEQDGILKLVGAKKIKSPFIADTVLWSNYLSNTSSTKFPSLLVPSEALTLDIKW